MLPQPNQNFISPTQQPTNNYYQGGQPDTPCSTCTRLRIDYNFVDADRLFFRGNGNSFDEGTFDWTYEAPDDFTRCTTASGSATAGRSPATGRARWANRHRQPGLEQPVLPAGPLLRAGRVHADRLRAPGLHGRFLHSARHAADCRVVNIGGYQAMSNGVERRRHHHEPPGPGRISRSVKARTRCAAASTSAGRGVQPSRAAIPPDRSRSTTPTRAPADTTTDFPAANLGLSLAAFMLGIPSTASIAEQSTAALEERLLLSVRTGFVARDAESHGQPRPALRVRERDHRGRTIGCSSASTRTPQLAITQTRAGGLREPTRFRRCQRASSASSADRSSRPTPARTARSWKGQAMWMPRLSATYKLGDRTVLKGGYGLFYDTLNAADFNPNQTGYDVTTTNTVSTDFGQTWLLGDPRTECSPLTNPFPVRSDGSRFDTPIGSSLGVDTLLGTELHGQQPESRASDACSGGGSAVQRELTRNTAVEWPTTARLPTVFRSSIAQSYVPEIYYNSSNVRDNAQQVFLQHNVTNPFRITNFASLQARTPRLYQRMAGNAFFTATTVQRQALLRDFPQMSGLSYADLPLGKIKIHQLEIMLNRRFSQGLSANAAFSATRATLNRTVEAYDREPTLWQTSNSARPFRVTAGWVYQLPFGPGKPFFAEQGIVASILGGWQASGTYRVPPGALLDWDNIFFYGDFGDIAIDNPQIALLPDGTIDPTKRWFNIDAGFEEESRQAAGRPSRNASSPSASTACADSTLPSSI